MPTLLNVSDLTVGSGQPLGVSEWLDVTQERIDAFARVTGDTQWLHTDPARAAQSPFGTTVAHGFLTLSLVSRFLMETIAIDGARMVVNYGLDRVRFVAPVPAGSRIRAGFTVRDLQPFDSGTQVGWTVVVEREGQPKPCCVADWLVRYYR